MVIPVTTPLVIVAVAVAVVDPIPILTSGVVEYPTPPVPPIEIRMIPFLPSDLINAVAAAPTPPPPSSWDIWCHTAYDFKNPCFQIRPPEEGFVVVGGLVHETEALPLADVLIGRETLLEEHVDSFVEKIEGIFRKCSEVVTLAAQAHHAEF